MVGKENRMQNNNSESKTKKSSFLEIINSWPDYFENMDEGLGTTYERFILHRYFNIIKDRFHVESILETPSFGMTGVSNINSLWWSAKGIVPIVLDNHAQRVQKSQKVWQDIPLSVDMRVVDDFHSLPVDDQSVDVSWNFAALWFVENLDAFFSELNRVTRKAVFICVPNNYGIGYQLRARLNDTQIPGFYLHHILPKSIQSAADKFGWKLWKRGYLDIPPWPDIAMKKEVLFSKLGLGFLIKKNTASASETRTNIVDYFNGRNPDLEEQILKYSYLENAPTPIKQIWGHHRYFIYEK